MPFIHYYTLLVKFSKLKKYHNVLKLSKPLLHFLHGRLLQGNSFEKCGYHLKRISPISTYACTFSADASVIYFEASALQPVVRSILFNKNY